MVELVRFKVKNFKSIDEIEIDIGDFNIFVGKNNSGKSTILDAIEIFLKSLRHEEDPLDDHVWPRGILDDRQIEFTALFKLTRDDVRGVSRGDRITDLNDRGHMIVKVTRNIRSDKRWTPSILSFRSPVTGPMTEEHIERLKKELLSKLQEIIGTPKRIDVIRGQIQSAISRPGLRGTLIPDDTLERIRDWTDSRRTGDLSRFREMNEILNQLTGREWDLRQEGQHLCVLDDGYPIEVRALGGGIQEMIHLAYELVDSPSIVMIEEPEAHSHPEQTKRMLDVLRKLSTDKTILITTHSSVFTNLSDFSEIFHVTLESGHTNCTKIDDEEFPSIAEDLGIEPADVFMTSKIVFVEGSCDRMAIESWASMLGSSLKNPTVEIIEMEGMGNAKREIRVWKKVVQSLKVPMVWIFDNDVDARFIDDLAAAGAKRDNIIVLDKGSIEDYYPIQLVTKALEVEWDVTNSKMPNLESALVEDSRAERIYEILGEHGDPEPTKNGWKRPLAKYIVKENREDVYNEDELREVTDLIDRILAKK